MTLVQLNYFKTLAQILHYTKAAETLHIAQPSLSYSISELEKELGVKLFIKKDRKISLTVYGERFLPYVEAALATLNNGVEDLKQFSTSSKQEVRLGYFHSIASSLIPSLVSGLYQRDENRDLRFQFTQATSYEILNMLKKGGLDLAFCMHRDEWIESIPVMQQQLYLAVPEGHRLAGKSSVSFEDFCHEAFVMLDKDSSLRVLVDHIFAKHNVVPNVLFVVRECDAALQYVALNFCVSILPQVPAMETDKISILPICGETDDFTRTVYLSWLKERPLSPAIRRIRDYVVEQCTFGETE